MTHQESMRWGSGLSEHGRNSSDGTYSG